MLDRLLIWTCIIGLTCGAIGWMLGGSPLAPVALTEIHQPGVSIEVLDPTLDHYATMWQREVARRFPNAIGIIVHGGDFVQGQWIVGSGFPGHVTPVSEIVGRFQRLHPDKTIVVISCNPGHVHLNIPGVYYALDSVWCVPDRSLTPELMTQAEGMAKLDGEDYPYSSPNLAGVNRWEVDPGVVGSIFEFVTD